MSETIIGANAEQEKTHEFPVPETQSVALGQALELQLRKQMQDLQSFIEVAESNTSLQRDSLDQQSVTSWRNSYKRLETTLKNLQTRKVSVQPKDGRPALVFHGEEATPSFEPGQQVTIADSDTFNLPDFAFALRQELVTGLTPLRLTRMVESGLQDTVADAIAEKALRGISATGTTITDTLQPVLTATKIEMTRQPDKTWQMVI